MFCSTFKQEDQKWASSVAKMRSMTPTDIGVNPKLILDAKSVFPNLLESSRAGYDSTAPRAGVYQASVDKLRELHNAVALILNLPFIELDW